MLRSALQKSGAFACKSLTNQRSLGAVRGMAKEIKFGVEGRLAMLEGVNILADAVQVRLKNLVLWNSKFLFIYCESSIIGQTRKGILDPFTSENHFASAKIIVACLDFWTTGWLWLTMMYSIHHGINNQIELPLLWHTKGRRIYRNLSEECFEQF